MNLKPCPFCGGEATNESYHSCDCCGKPFNGLICCLKCGAEVSHFDTEDQAITAWNTRAPQEDHRAGVIEGEIKGKLKGLREAIELIQY